MRWKVLTPFTRKRGAASWIPAQVAQIDPAQVFEVVPAHYQHDRSRKLSGGREWLDYFLHAARAWTGMLLSRQVGYVTAFPQLPMMLGLLKRLCRSRAPILAWCFNLGRTYDGRKGQLARFGLSTVDTFVVHSRQEIETYSIWLGLPRERFVFVPLSIDVVELDGQDHEDSAQPFLVAMGSANRDYRSLVAAVRALGYPTIIIASAHALQGIELPPNVEVRSGLSLAECHALCRRARVNVIPVDNETTASGQVTLLEAMMYAKAVVATDCVGTRDYVAEGVTGLLVPPHDVGALTAAIERLWQDTALRQSIGAHARQYVESHVSFKAVAVEMQRLLALLEAERGGTLGRRRARAA